MGEGGGSERKGSFKSVSVSTTIMNTGLGMFYTA